MNNSLQVIEHDVSKSFGDLTRKGESARSECISLVAELKSNLFELDATDEVNAARLVNMQSAIREIVNQSKDMIPRSDGLPLLRQKPKRGPVAPELPLHRRKRVANASDSVGTKHDYVHKFTSKSINDLW